MTFTDDAPSHHALAAGHVADAHAGRRLGRAGPDCGGGGVIGLHHGGGVTGTMLLAHAGVIEGRRASTHHQAMEDLAATGAQVIGDRVVDDGDLVTSGGVTSGIDLALWLVE